MGIINAISRPVWSKRDGFIPQGSTQVVDQIANTFKQASYILTVHNEAQNAFKRMNIDILRIGSTYQEIVYGKLNGGNASIDVDTNNNSGIMELRVTNNETHDLNLSLARVSLS